MPSKSENQRKFIFAKRAQYGTKEKAPSKWKWIFDKEWEKIKEKSITVKGYKSPEGGKDITDKELRILGKVYASAREQGYNEERSSKIAWGALNKYRNKKESIFIRYKSKFEERDGLFSGEGADKYLKYWYSFESLLSNKENLDIKKIENDFYEISTRLPINIIKGMLKHNSFYLQLGYDVEQIDKLDNKMIKFLLEKILNKLHYTHILKFIKKYIKEGIKSISFEYDPYSQIIKMFVKTR